MKWVLYEKVYNRVVNNHGFLSEPESNFVLNSNWCHDFSFDNEFDSPQEAYDAFKKLCEENKEREYATDYRGLNMVCLPSFTISHY